jgi:hypothetical protein
MPRGRGIYEDEPRTQLENANVSEGKPEADEAPDETSAQHTTEPPD